MNLKNQIIELRKTGLKYDEIHKKLNCAKSTISYHCDKNGMGDDYLKYLNFKLSDDDINKVVELRKNGTLYDEIRNITNLSMDKIKLICRVNGITDNNEYRKPSPEIVIEMQKYYDECGTIYKVAEKFGFNRHTIRKYIEINVNIPQTKNERKKNISKSVIKWRQNVKLKLIEYKGGKCEICGYSKCLRNLTFHHNDPNMKDFNISAKSYSFYRMKSEVDKCTLVCANCHGEIHEEFELNKNN